MSITKADIENIQMKVSVQKGLSGCMVHSLYSLTHDSFFLNYENENSPEKFLIIVQSRGYLLWPLLALPPGEPLTEKIWNRMSNHCQINDYRKRKIWKLLASVIMNKDDNHMIAMEIDYENDDIKIMDPMYGKIIPYTGKGFLNSPYKKVYELLVVDSGELKDYPPIPGK